MLPIYCISQPTNLIKDEDISGTLSDDIDEEKDNQPCGEETSVKLRLSTGKDLRLPVYTLDTILKVKKKLHKMEGVEPAQQRWFYAGRMLTDKMTIEEAKIQKSFVIQVILPQPTPVDN